MFRRKQPPESDDEATTTAVSASGTTTTATSCGERERERERERAPPSCSHNSIRAETFRATIKLVTTSRRPRAGIRLAYLIRPQRGRGDLDGMQQKRAENLRGQKTGSKCDLDCIASFILCTYLLRPEFFPGKNRPLFILFPPSNTAMAASFRVTRMRQQRRRPLQGQRGEYRRHLNEKALS